jgi:hypothetical protein
MFKNSRKLRHPTTLENFLLSWTKLHLVKSVLFVKIGLYLFKSKIAPHFIFHFKDLFYKGNSSTQLKAIFIDLREIYLYYGVLRLQCAYH